MDVGPLTIDYILNSRGNHVYRFEARTVKQVDVRMLNKIRIKIQKELKRQGILIDSDTKYYLANKARRDKEALAYYHRNKDAINERRRKK